jgi:TonB-dependent receptor
MQARVNYAKTIARPAFGDLNPGLFYDIPQNANVRPNGFGGNPDLKPEKSDSFDATVEYYFGRSNYVSVAGYYRNIKDRTISQQLPETIDGIEYLITRPRNTSAAKLKGVEVAGQAFFDWLPGALGGFGVLANFTLADSKITSQSDVLNGYPLLGVSKYSYNLGLLYEKYGVTGRVIYTSRSEYNEFLLGGGFLQPGAQAAFNKVRPNGRLDFSVGYDVLPNVTISVEGTNITRSRYLSYFDVPIFPHDIRDDETTYGVGVRARF